MSVTKEGIQGYEYQYKITALLSLLMPSIMVKLYVEIEGSEDATIILEEGKLKKTIEIQVKKEKKNLNISKLTEWLCHFEERKTNKNLLQRIIDNKNTIALFVTLSRCSDETAVLNNDFSNYSAHPKLSINKRWKDTFNNALENTSLKSWGNLTIKRKTFCKKQAKNFNTLNDLKDVLKRIIIWEQITDEKINNEVKTILNLNFQIPQSKINDVYLQLLEIVKKGRDEGINIQPLINDLLPKFKSRQPSIDSYYQQRKEEVRLIKELDDNNVLLLTGMSLCGKSEIAKKISSYFFYKGYNYELMSNINDVYRFFETNTNEKKIALLEDPWGHSQLNSSFLEIKSNIEKLIKNIGNDNKLIVTSKIEIVFEVFPTNNLEDCKLYNYSWHDLTISDITDTNKYFLKIAERKLLPKVLVDLISDNLLKSDSENLLQIGQISYLINLQIEKLLNKSFQDLEHLARYNSKEIALEIKRENNYFAEVLSIIALCATTIESTKLIDIGYILSNDPKEYSFVEKDVFSSSFDTKENDYPQYILDYSNIDIKLSTCLEYLEERQLIIIRNEKIIFRHPNYYEAGRFLFFSQSSIKQKRFFNYYKTVLSCINPKTTYLATKQFSFIYKKISPIYKPFIIDLAFLSLNSIYPATEDNSLIFLINLISELEEEKSKEIIRKTQSGGTDKSHIYWHHNTPYISNKGGFFHSFSIKITEEKIKEISSNLSDNKLVPIYDAYVYLEKFGYEKSIILSYSILKTLLKYSESFIRKEAAYLAIHNYKNLNNEIAIKVFNDEHPSVVYSAIRATFINWARYSKPKQKILFSLLQKSLTNKSIAIRTFSLISTFSIDYSHEGLYNWEGLNEIEKKALWNLWGKLFPIVYSQVPKDVIINTARFSASMSDSIKYIDIKLGVKVFESWYQRVDFLIQNDKYLDEFEMTIALELMGLTKKEYEIRKPLFNKLVTYQDTNFLLSSLKWFVSYWKDLHINERNQIINLMSSDRSDIRWIKAVLLTSNNPPKEIVYEILREQDMFNKDVKHIISKFPSQLLRDCLNVYCGFPQPLWWLAVHHKNNKFWNKIIRHIMLNEEISGFDICIEEFTSHCVNGLSEEWKDGIEFWEEVCEKTKNKKILTENLIYATASCTCNLTTTKKLWDGLIDSYSLRDNEKELLSIIRDNIEILQQTGHKEDLFKIFDKDFLTTKVILELIPDGMLINVLHNISTNQFFDTEEKIKTVFPFLEISKKMNIRFFGTFNFFKNLSDSKNFPIEITNELRSFSNNINEIGQEKFKEIKKLREYELDNWIIKCT